MTLSAYDIPITERRDIEDYDVELVCANPRCHRPIAHNHHIERRSATGGPVSWIEIPGRYIIGNKVGVCAPCHDQVDGGLGGHKAMILWDERSETLQWIDFNERWAEALDPMPPVSKLGPGPLEAIREAPQEESMDVTPEGLERFEEEIPVDAIAPDWEEPELEPAPRARSILEQVSEDPVEPEPEQGAPPEEEGLGDEATQQLARRVQATHALVNDLREGTGPAEPEPTPAEEQLIRQAAGPVPVERHEAPEPFVCVNCGRPAIYSPDDVVFLHLEPYGEDDPNRYYCDATEETHAAAPLVEVGSERSEYAGGVTERSGVESMGSDEFARQIRDREAEGPQHSSETMAAIDRARKASEQAQRRAEDSIEETPSEDPATQWFIEHREAKVAELAIDPETLETQLLRGELQVKLLIDEAVDRAKKVRKRKPEQLPKGPGQEGVPKRTYSLSVPAEERSEEKGRLGEDGHTLLEAYLTTIAEKIGRSSEGAGWRYYVLIDALAWFVLNYTPEGEEES